MSRRRAHVRRPARRRIGTWLPLGALATCMAAAAVSGATGLGTGGAGTSGTTRLYRQGARAGEALAPTAVKAAKLAGPRSASTDPISAAAAGKATKPLNLSPLYSGPGIPAPSASSVVPGGVAPTAVPASSIHPSVTAPPGFRTSLVHLYSLASSVTASAQAANPSSAAVGQAPSVRQFTQAIDSVPLVYLSELYDATRNVSGFTQLSSVYSSIGAAQQGSAGGVAGIAAAKAHAAAALAAPSTTSPGTGVTFAPATTETTTAADNSATCAKPDPGGDYGVDSIYAANLVVDAFTVAASFVPESIVQGDFVLGEGLVITVPDPAWVAVMALYGAAQIARDTLVWHQTVSTTCNTRSQQAQVHVIFDNVNSLIGLVDARTTAIDDEEQLLYALVESRTTLILNKIAVIQASLNLELKVTIEEDLLQGTAGAVSMFELPAADGGYLNASPIGVQSLVTGALTSTEHDGEASNPAAPQDLASANADLANGQYKAAFALYAQAYREIVGS